MHPSQEFITMDRSLISVLKKYSEPLARFALFAVFFWFGALKVLVESPANPMVASLLGRTLPALTFSTFIILFGLYEMAIGVLFLIRGLERVAIGLLVPHMIATFLPLILLPSITWHSWFVPTLEGQYIIKNLVIITLAFSIGAHLHPLKK